jgi:hypothetical protein
MVLDYGYKLNLPTRFLLPKATRFLVLLFPTDSISLEENISLTQVTIFCIGISRQFFVLTFFCIDIVGKFTAVTLVLTLTMIVVKWTVIQGLTGATGAEGDLHRERWTV